MVGSTALEKYHRKFAFDSDPNGYFFEEDGCDLAGNISSLLCLYCVAGDRLAGLLDWRGAMGASDARWWPHWCIATKWSSRRGILDTNTCPDGGRHRVSGKPLPALGTLDGPCSRHRTNCGDNVKLDDSVQA